MNILSLIGRDSHLITDISKHEKEISGLVSDSTFLVLGGAGSIGQSVVKELFIRNPQKLHVVDISENNLVELVRDLRSSYGYMKGDFKTYALDIGSREFDVYYSNAGKFDYVLNLSALKHVRSEKDPYTLMRMIDVNILNTIKTIEMSISSGVKKYFCVSTDKAANPANMMGASKRIMEMFLAKYGEQIDISTARFANVAFSDGSLLYGFRRRIEKNQPIAAPNDVHRYFVTPKEAGELCLMAFLFGQNREIFFPKLSESLHLVTFSEIAVRFLREIGYEPMICKSEQEARDVMEQAQQNGKWPCYFSNSNTTGEKEYEEFALPHETVNLDKFNSLGIVKNDATATENKLDLFLHSIREIKSSIVWQRVEILNIFKQLLPDFNHYEKGNYLDDKM
jgi:UDP-N-acetylglucosamine 4,6-dehydratase